MRNYIILNDINSNTINGLLIQELPPISKPKMRTRTEEIDGRAGDIVTQLGFKAYDKTIKIGLYGDFDINEVISYFNSSGQVVFSNEPDKYYNYQIVDQIDYERLIRFRTAKVKMHVQPFKYPTEEEPLVGQYQYVTNTGSNMSLDNTANALFKKFDLKGNTSQNGTPTPDTPIPVNVVSGDNYINICGKNLADITYGYVPSISNGNLVSSQYGCTSQLIRVDTSKNYIGTYTGTASLYLLAYDENDGYLGYVNGSYFTTLKNNYPTLKKVRVRVDGSANNPTPQVQFEVGSSSTTYEPYIGNTYPIYLGVENLFDVNVIQERTIQGITMSFNGQTIHLQGTATGNANFYMKSGSSFTLEAGTYFITRSSMNGIATLKLSSGSTTIVATGSTDISFTLSQATTIDGLTLQVPRSVGTISKDITISITKGNTPQHISTTPIELCKIGTYQDYIYKENGNWYLHKEIGKVVLDGSENITLSATDTDYTRFNVAITGVILGSSSTYTLIRSNYYYPKYAVEPGAIFISSTQNIVGVIHNSVITLANYKTWLSTNKPSVYYVLATPTNTLIEDTTLIEQLEEIKGANSYEGQTNISHDSNDAPFLVDVSALQSGTDELVVDNEGNIYSRPTLDLEGTGIVNVYLEGNQMFQVDLTDTNEIVIDTDEMEAYNPTTQALMNRQVTGNYDNFKLNVGDNTLKFSGDLTKATVTNYVRWL